MNVRGELVSPRTRNRQQMAEGNLFITQTVLLASNEKPGDRLIATAPKSGQQAHRTHKMAPLLTPAHNRALSMNVSQLDRYGGPEPITPMDIDREKSKIARFLTTKERCGLRFLERNAKAEARLKEIENRTVDFEKRKKIERKMAAQKLKEK